MELLSNHSLKSFNTFGIAVEAKQFVEIRSIKDLSELSDQKQFENDSHLILGGGSNVLFKGNFNGLVVKNGIKGIVVEQEDEHQVQVKFMSGELWHHSVLHCIERGWGGIENLSLIPGLMGAAPMQNIGAYGVELKDVFVKLEAFHLATGELHTFNNTDCKFAYRESVFKHQFKGDYCIVSVSLQLQKKPTFNVSYGAIQQTLEANKVSELSLKAVSDAVIQIRSSKLPDPKVIGNSGSFFKNPIIDATAFDTLKANFPDVPSYPTPNDQIKVPAGWLIDQCGWKGKVVGNTGTHKNHALVLVNHGGATGEEVYELAMEIKESVFSKFNIQIAPEVNLI